MNISFDLDSTLIPNGNEFETEKRSIFANILHVEAIRKGTCSLFSELQNSGHRIHIYTTSFRTKRIIRRTFRCYGVKVDRIVNQTQNQKTLKSLGISASKYPPAFDFDLHIDDSKGVGIEAERFNFNVIIVDPTDSDWVEQIIKRIKELSNSPS